MQRGLKDLSKEGFSLLLCQVSMQRGLKGYASDPPVLPVFGVSMQRGLKVRDAIRVAEKQGLMSQCKEDWKLEARSLQPLRILKSQCKEDWKSVECSCSLNFMWDVSMQRGLKVSSPYSTPAIRLPSQCKEDWKSFGFIDSSFSKKVSQCKEDWKTGLTQLEQISQRLVSMQRGLKDFS